MVEGNGGKDDRARKLSQKSFVSFVKYTGKLTHTIGRQTPVPER
jgi:hypothetical protein